MLEAGIYWSSVMTVCQRKAGRCVFGQWGSKIFWYGCLLSEILVDLGGYPSFSLEPGGLEYVLCCGATVCV